MTSIQTEAPKLGLAGSTTECAVVKFADMSEAMQQHAVDCASYAFQQKRILDDIA